MDSRPGSESLLDYGLIDNDHVGTVSSFVIDEQAAIDARYLPSLKKKFNYLHDRMRLSMTTIKSKLCNSMNEYHSMALINAINVERRKVGKHAIPACDDMCVTALLKGMVQKVYLLLNF